MEKKKYNHVFWDWNGTILDDLNVNFEVINALLSMHEKNSISLREYRSVFSFPIKEFYGKIGLPIDDKKYEQLVSDYWNLYKNRIKDIPLMAGVLDILCVLRKIGVKQYILSASDKIMIFDQISMYGIQDYFEDIIAPHDGYASGKIELAKQWMSNQNISTSNVILIGDTIHDYETAKAIGIDCALIDSGHQDLNVFKYDSNLMIFNNIDEMRCHIFGIKVD